MLRPAKSRENFAGKLLLSSALVAVSLGYGWWQRHNPAGPAVAVASTSPTFVPKTPMPAHDDSTTAAPASVAPIMPATPDAKITAEAGSASKQTETATAAQTNIAAAIPTAPAPPTVASSSSPPPAALYAPAYLPTDDVSPPIPLATGTPAPGVAPSIPASAGTHLLDGDYVSDRHQLEWGDLRVKISVHGGQITGVQILQYPDHRSHSLDLSLMAGPTLESEVIKTQRAQVDAVSSATDTSYAFQDTIADVIVKAARE